MSDENWYDKGEGSEYMKRQIAKDAKSHTYLPVCDDRECDEILKSRDYLKELINTVLINCNPPDDCNDPKVLKMYMKACYDKANQFPEDLQIRDEL